jgi:serine palmitoyltransferase
MQRINSAAVVFSAALPPLLAVAATEAIKLLGTPSISGGYPLDPLPENVRTVRTVLEKAAGDGQTIELLSHPISPFVHLALSRARIAHGSLSREDQERLLQDVVDEALANGVLLTRAKRVWEQELVATVIGGDARPTIRICVSAALPKKELEKAANVIRSACSKMLSRKRS